MSALDGWFAVFRAGTWTDSGGTARTFGRDDLDGIAAGYDGSAQCVITHDELYSPFGYARVAALRREGDLLEARVDPETVEPQFRALVESDRLHNRSIQLLPAADGGWRLSHVAWLGAEPPAVEGLAPVALSVRGVTFAAEDAWESYEDARRWSRWLRALREIAVSALGEERAAEVVPDWEVDQAAEDAGAARERARTETEERPMTQYTQEQLDAAVEAGAATARSEEAARLAAERAAFARDRAAAAVVALVEAGAVTPAQAAGMAEFAAALPEAEIRFSAPGEQAETATGARDWFWSFVGSLGDGVRTGPRTGAERERPALPADAAGVKRVAAEYRAAQRAAGNDIGMIEAIAAVARGAR